jgi:uncharacterized GH25 family protein
MFPRFRASLAVTLLVLLAPAAWGHFHLLLPEKASARKGETVAFVYRFGHPFEHQLFDAPPPQRILVIAPDGTDTDLSKTVERIKVAGEKKQEVTAYRFRFTPQQRGDYVFLLEAPPVWMEEAQEFIQDSVRVTLHVQGQKGWGAPAPAATERSLWLVPLTRPYGLQPGMVFQAQAVLRLVKEVKAGGALVEVERYNPAPPAKLPPDEHITRAAKTDPNGVVTTTLTEPGWWSLTVQRSSGERERKGKTYPVRHRATLWVWVDPPLGSK